MTRKEERSLERKVYNIIKEENMIKANEKVVVGVSGGPDSLVLLTILKKLEQKLKCKIIAAHMNHLIRPDSTDDEKFVENYCKNLDIPFYKKRVKVLEVAKKEKMGTEEAARKVRYEFLEEILEKTNSNKIAIAHNKKDNAETVLLHIIRGCGVSGLKGIDINNGKYIRPLLRIDRKEIEDYCTENNLEPRIDSTNIDNSYTRNRIRNKLIPYIEENFNKNIIKELNNLASIVNDEERYFEEKIPKIYENLCISHSPKCIQLDLKLFNIKEKVIKQRIVRYTIEKLLGNCNQITFTNIEDILELCSKNIGKKEIIPNKNIKIFVDKGKIFFESLL